MDKSNFWHSRKINDHINPIKANYIEPSIMVDYPTPFMGRINHWSPAWSHVVRSWPGKLNKIR